MYKLFPPLHLLNILDMLWHIITLAYIPTSYHNKLFRAFHFYVWAIFDAVEESCKGCRAYTCVCVWILFKEETLWLIGVFVWIRASLRTNMVAQRKSCNTFLLLKNMKDSFRQIFGCTAYVLYFQLKNILVP
jgi:hypothetical protein